MVWLLLSGFLMRAQTFMYMIVHMGCTDTVRESALELDSGREIPCHSWNSNLCHSCTGLAFHYFSQTLHQLSYSWSLKSSLMYTLTLTCTLIQQAALRFPWPRVCWTGPELCSTTRRAAGYVPVVFATSFAHCSCVHENWLDCQLVPLNFCCWGSHDQFLLLLTGCFALMDEGNGQ